MSSSVPPTTPVRTACVIRSSPEVAMRPRRILLSVSSASQGVKEPCAGRAPRVRVANLQGAGDNDGELRSLRSREMIRSIGRVWTASGAGGLARAVGSRAWHRRRFVRFRIDLEQWDPGPPPSPPLGVRKGLPELLHFRERAGRALPVQFFQDEMHGAACPYLGLWEGEVGHISWLFTEGGHGRRVHLIDLGPDEVELDGAFTFRDFRGKGLLSVVEREMLRDARSTGARFGYTHVEDDNIASIKGVLKTGFEAHGLVTFVRLLGFEWLRWRPTTPSESALVGR